MSGRDKFQSMIRVNQAGEYGAKRIYEGQLAVVRDPHAREKIEHMKEQELVHLDEFNRRMEQERVRPTLLQPLWHVGGFAMGALTARLGEKAAMACTDAVESVIDEHYADQLEQLGDTDPELSQVITKFREEELEHKATAIEEGAHEAFAYPVLTGAVKSATRLAIWLSKRI